jgi:hypothetical protein
MFFLFGLFAIVAISNGACTISTASELGMSYWNYIQLSDFGMLMKMFEVHPMWATVNIAAGLTIMILMFASMIGQDRIPVRRRGSRRNWTIR